MYGYNGREYLFIVLYLTTLFQQLKLYSVAWSGDKWMINWEGFGRKQSWPEFKVRVLYLRTPWGTGEIRKIACVKDDLLEGDVRSASSGADATDRH
jgi:hypothetical protein